MKIVNTFSKILQISRRLSCNFSARRYTSLVQSYTSPIAGNVEEQCQTLCRIGGNGVGENRFHFRWHRTKPPTLDRSASTIIENNVAFTIMDIPPLLNVAAIKIMLVPMQNISENIAKENTDHSRSIIRRFSNEVTPNSASLKEFHKYITIKLIGGNTISQSNGILGATKIPSSNVMSSKFYSTKKTSTPAQEKAASSNVVGNAEGSKGCVSPGNAQSPPYIPGKDGEQVKESSAIEEGKASACNEIFASQKYYSGRLLTFDGDENLLNCHAYKDALKKAADNKTGQAALPTNPSTVIYACGGVSGNIKCPEYVPKSGDNAVKSISAGEKNAEYCVSVSSKTQKEGDSKATENKKSTSCDTATTVKKANTYAIDRAAMICKGTVPKSIIFNNGSLKPAMECKSRGMHASKKGGKDCKDDPCKEEKEECPDKCKEEMDKVRYNEQLMEKKKKNRKLVGCPPSKDAKKTSGACAHVTPKSTKKGGAKKYHTVSYSKRQAIKFHPKPDKIDTKEYHTMALPKRKDHFKMFWKPQPKFNPRGEGIAFYSNRTFSRSALAFKESKGSPCKDKSKKQGKSKENPCTSHKKEPKPKGNENPCDSMKKKTDSSKKDGAKKASPCKKKDDSKKKGDAKKSDPCKKKGDAKKKDDAKKASPCKTKGDSKKKDDAKKSDPCKKKGDAKKKDDAKKASPCKTKGDSKKKDDAKKSDPCKKKGDAKKKDDAKKASPCKTKGDSKKKDDAKKNDPCKKKGDAKKKDDAKKANPCKKQDDAKKKGDAKKKDACKKKGDTKKKNPCKKKDDAKKKAASKNGNPCKKKDTSSDKDKKKDGSKKTVCGATKKNTKPNCKKYSSYSLSKLLLTPFNGAKGGFSTYNVRKLFTVSNMSFRRHICHFKLTDYPSLFNTQSITKSITKAADPVKRSISTYKIHKGLNIKNFGFNRQYSSSKGGKDKKEKKDGSCSQGGTVMPKKRKADPNAKRKHGLVTGCYKDDKGDDCGRKKKKEENTGCKDFLKKNQHLLKKKDGKDKENKKLSSLKSSTEQSKVYPDSSLLQSKFLPAHSYSITRRICRTAVHKSRNATVVNCFGPCQEKKRSDKQNAKREKTSNRNSITKGIQSNEIIKICEACQVNRIHRELPRFDDYDVLIKVSHVALSGSDIHIYEHGSNNSSRLTLGHDATGIIEQTGKCILGLRRGDRVVVESGISCGVCEFCKRGAYNTCMRHIYNGFLMKYQAHPGDLCYKLPDNLDMREAALTHTLAQGCQAVFKAGIKPNTNVLVMGASPVAVASALCARAVGAKQVVLTCTMHSALKEIHNDYDFDYVHFDHCVQFDEILEAIFCAFNDWPDVVINCSINQLTMNLAVMSLRPCGICILVECESEGASFNALNVLMKNIRLLPSFRCVNMFPTALNLMNTGRTPMSRMIASCFSWTDTGQAFKQAQHESNYGYKKIIVECLEENFNKCDSGIS